MAWLFACLLGVVNLVHLHAQSTINITIVSIIAGSSKLLRQLHLIRR